MKKLILSPLLLAATFSANADVLMGADVEANIWQQNYTYNNQDSGDDLTYTLEASLEHPLPLIPNVKFARSAANADDFEYTKQDFTLYYEILDNDMISFDIGAGATNLTNGKLGSQTFEGYVPHLYAAAELGIPATPLFLFAKGSGISYSGDKMTDFSAGIRYAIGLGLVSVELQAGYRVQSFNLDGFDDLTVDLDTSAKGFFTGVNLDF